MARIQHRIGMVALFCALTTGLTLSPLAYSATSSTATHQKTSAAKTKVKAKARKVVQATKTVKAKVRSSVKTVAVRKPEVAAHIRHASFAPLEDVGGHLAVKSSVAFVQDLSSSDVLFAKNDELVTPIASITKLMTALVVVDAHQPMDEVIEVTNDDIDKRKFTRSRLSVGTRLSRADMLHLALMSSENRAANALGRNYPGGLPAFVAAMNAKAALLGMHDTHYEEPTGLSSENVSSARDLVRLLQVAATRPVIHEYTTATHYEVDIKGRPQMFRNTNPLVSKSDWDVTISKTGFINEAGRCLIMMAKIGGRDLAIVLLDGVGAFTRTADAVRIRNWLKKEGATLKAAEPSLVKPAV